MNFNIEKLKPLVQHGESETLEFKKSTAKLHAIFETICGFLNNQGGIVLIGVTDKGGLTGQNVTDSTKREIANELAKIEPPAEVKIHYMTLEKAKYIIAIEVSPGQHAPYVYEGCPYEREQSTTKRMSQHRYDQLLLKRNQFNFSWEKSEAEDYSLADLDHDLIAGVVRQGVEAKRMPEQALRQKIPKLLESLQLLIDGRLRKAAVVLFGKRFDVDYIQCQLKMARFKGINRHEFLDSDAFSGNIFESLDKGMFFVRRHLPVAAKIVPDQLQRVETPLIPFDAVREALINAFTHRNYSALSGAIGLAIYDNRMEIFNHGGLLPGVTIEKIKSGFSNLRNPLIAEILFRCNLIERWGRGIPDMTDSCVSSGDPMPEFFSDALEFKVTFPFSQSISPPVISFEEEKSIFNQLSPRQQRIYQLLNEAASAGLSPAELMNILKKEIPERTLRRELKNLEGVGLVESRGQTRKIRWYAH